MGELANTYVRTYARTHAMGEQVLASPEAAAGPVTKLTGHNLINPSAHACTKLNVTRNRCTTGDLFAVRAHADTCYKTYHVPRVVVVLEHGIGQFGDSTQETPPP